MSTTDANQDKRIETNSTGIASNKADIALLRTEQALTGQKVDALRCSFDTGMIKLSDTLEARDIQAREDAKQARLDAREDAKIAREDARWFWGKVFGVVGSLVTLAGAGTYLTTADQSPTEQVENANPNK